MLHSSSSSEQGSLDAPLHRPEYFWGLFSSLALQLLPDLLKRDVGFPQLFWASEKGFTPGGILAVHCMGLVRKRPTHLYACQTKSFCLRTLTFLSSIQKYPSFQRHRPSGRSFAQTKDMLCTSKHRHRIVSATVMLTLVQRPEANINPCSETSANINTCSETSCWWCSETSSCQN